MKLFYYYFFTKTQFYRCSRLRQRKNPNSRSFHSGLNRTVSTSMGHSSLGCTSAGGNIAERNTYKAVRYTVIISCGGRGLHRVCYHCSYRRAVYNSTATSVPAISKHMSWYLGVSYAVISLSGARLVVVQKPIKLLKTIRNPTALCRLSFATSRISTVVLARRTASSIMK